MKILRIFLSVVTCMCVVLPFDDALATCVGATVTATGGLAGGLVISNQPDNTVVSQGRITFTGTNCTSAVGWLDNAFTLGYTPNSLINIPGLQIYSTNGSGSIDSTNCSGSAIGATPTYPYDYLWLMYTPYNGQTGCNIVVSVGYEIKINRALGSASGTIPGNNQLGVGTHLGPVAGWVFINDHGGGGVQYVAGADALVTAVSCTVSPSSLTVTLPTVGTNALNGSGKTAGKTPFTIFLTGCNNGSNAIKTATATWTFQSNGPTSTTIGNTDPSPAPGVFVQLLDSSGNAIDGTTGNANNITTIGSVPATGGSVSPVTYYAQYYSNTATPGAGGVKGVATFNVSYN